MKKLIKIFAIVILSILQIVLIGSILYVQENKNQIKETNLLRINLLNEPDTLRIMTFNVQGGNVRNAEHGNAKMLEVANYIKLNNIDIVALQEMTDWTNASNDPGQLASKIQGDDTVWIEQHLKNIKYPMYCFNRPYVMGTSSGKNVTCSKYPLIENTLDYFEIAKKKRWALTTSFNTHLGKVTIINLHTYAGKVSKTPLCDQVNVVNKKIQTELNKDPRIIAMGDWNLFLYIPSYCFGANWPSRYKFLCDDSCKEESGNVDFAITPIVSDFELIDEWEDKTVTLSDHNPVISVLKVNNIPTPMPTSPPTIKASCVGFNIYDNEDKLPNIIKDSATKKVIRNLTDRITIRTVSGGDVKKNSVCWAPDGLSKVEYFQSKNWVCMDVCGEIFGSTIGICEDKTINSGYVTNTVEGYLDKFSTEEVKDLAMQNGLVFVTNVQEKDGGICSTNPGFSEAGVYFEAGVKFNELTGADIFDSTTSCGVAADGNNCVRRVEIAAAGINEVMKEDIDFAKDGKVGIDDFMKFVEYYKAGDCKVDLNKNTKCREIADFQEFIKGYKLFYAN
ncbi:endonuclease/exonuclease/phosphatase family protein [Candidatus Dojkabacteria bacterium]|nr:endonuclease/exonuclease/phosphatase family protein [Candidatus Dojkabacteria bacterium]